MTKRAYKKIVGKKFVSTKDGTILEVDGVYSYSPGYYIGMFYVPNSSVPIPATIPYYELRKYFKEVPA